MKFELNDYNRNTPDNLLIEDLKLVAKKLNKDSVTHEEYNLNGKYSSSTYVRRFGSWFSALEKTGLQKTRSPLNITEEDLFKNLEEIWIKIGRQPLYQEIKKPLSKISVGTYENRFGTWRKALEKFVLYINSDLINEDDITNNSLETATAVENSEIILKHKTKREISDRLRFRILMRDGFTCKKCGRSPIKEMGVELHVDHIIPWSRGGETVSENLETKCKKCNLGKGNAFNE